MQVWAALLRVTALTLKPTRPRHLLRPTDAPTSRCRCSPGGSTRALFPTGQRSSRAGSPRGPSGEYGPSPDSPRPRAHLDPHGARAQVSFLSLVLHSGSSRSVCLGSCTPGLRSSVFGWSSHTPLLSGLEVQQGSWHQFRCSDEGQCSFFINQSLRLAVTTRTRVSRASGLKYPKLSLT